MANCPQIISKLSSLHLRLNINNRSMYWAGVRGNIMASLKREEKMVEVTMQIQVWGGGRSPGFQNLWNQIAMRAHVGAYRARHFQRGPGSLSLWRTALHDIREASLLQCQSGSWNVAPGSCTAVCASCNIVGHLGGTSHTLLSEPLKTWNENAIALSWEKCLSSTLVKF